MGARDPDRGSCVWEWVSEWVWFAVVASDLEDCDKCNFTNGFLYSYTYYSSGSKAHSKAIVYG